MQLSRAKPGNPARRFIKVTTNLRDLENVCVNEVLV